MLLLVKKYITYRHSKIKIIQTDEEWCKIGKIFNNKTFMFVKFQGLSIIKKVNKCHWESEDDLFLKAQVK